VGSGVCCRRWALVVVWMGLALAACSPRGVSEEDAAWALPFPLDPGNGCQTVATPFSVANPWDWAHEAIDYACVAGTSVFAVQSGVVSGVEWVEVGTAGLRGRLDIELDGMPVRVEYVNLGRVVVEEGQTVAKGDTLGFSALGLQVGVWDREAGRYVDPAPFLALPATE